VERRHHDQVASEDVVTLEKEEVRAFAPEVISKNANKRAISIGGMDKKAAAPTDIPIHSHKGVKNDGFEEEKA
jgi:hypothetical protein